MVFNRVVFRVHAIQRMYQRGITDEEVRQTIAAGEVIEDYPDDTPYPSRLVLGWRSSRPLHVVVADDTTGQTNIVITVYEPAKDEWDEDFKRRKKQ